MNKTQNSWDKQENETNRAYNAFLTYRNMGALRSLRKAVVEFYGITSDAKATQFFKWSSKYNWVVRCGDWDIEEEQLRIEQKRKDIREMDRRQAKDGMELSKIGMENIKLHAGGKIKDKKGKPAKPRIPVAESTKLFTAGIKAERLARGEVTEINEHKGELGIKIIRVEPEVAKKIGDELARKEGAK